MGNPVEKALGMMKKVENAEYNAKMATKQFITASVLGQTKSMEEARTLFHDYMDIYFDGIHELAVFKKDLEK